MSPLHATSREVLLGGTPRGRLLPPAVSRDTHSPIPDLGSAGMEHHSPCAPKQPLPRPPRRAGKSSSFHTAKTSFFLLEPPPLPLTLLQSPPLCHPSIPLSALQSSLLSGQHNLSSPAALLGGGVHPTPHFCGPPTAPHLPCTENSTSGHCAPVEASQYRDSSPNSASPRGCSWPWSCGGHSGTGGGDHHRPTHPTDPGLRCSPRGSTLVKTTAAAYTTLPGGSIHTAPVGAGDSRRPQSMDRALSGLRVATSSTEGAPMVLHT